MVKSKLRPSIKMIFVVSDDEALFKIDGNFPVNKTSRKQCNYVRAKSARIRPFMTCPRDWSD